MLGMKIHGSFNLTTLNERTFHSGSDCEFKTDNTYSTTLPKKVKKPGNKINRRFLKRITVVFGCRPLKIKHANSSRINHIYPLLISRRDKYSALSADLRFALSILKKRQRTKQNGY